MSTVVGARRRQPSNSTLIERELQSILGGDGVLPGNTAEYLADATESRTVRSSAEAIALPSYADDVARVVRWCYEHDVPIVPRGGGTGLAGGAVPISGGVVIGLERLHSVHRIDPELWRMRADAGLRTADLQRRARESGLYFPPDPGAAERSQLGGNVATNAGGPHAFKYGPTGAWVTGLQAVIAPGELIEVGGPIRKDVAGYDLKSLLIGSEGTLGIVTAVWLRLTPAPEAALPVAAAYASAREGCEAIENVLANGLGVAALEYLDAGALGATRDAFPVPLPGGAAFMVIAEADGSEHEAARLHAELVEVLRDGAISIHAPGEPRAIADLWRWRAGASLGVTAQYGGKISEDIVVPLDRLLDAIEATVEIGHRHRLTACSWGHAGDGNLHSTFMVSPDDPDQLRRAEAGAEDLFALACELGGSVSGEHGVGWVKRGALEQQWAPAAIGLHEAIKDVFDPKGLLNPGKKLARLDRQRRDAGLELEQ
jgi:glycolate oxidase subunit GlcD